MELRIAQLRKAKGMTQKDLAELCATTQQQIAKIETGTVDPQLSTIKRIAGALGCEVPDLFYTRDEFLREVNAVIKENKLQFKKVSLLHLNTVCFMTKRLPALHPYWEKIVIKNNKATFKEKKDEKIR
jgi:transcriptional regulator with XRE-family HTH domain